MIIISIINALMLFSYNLNIVKFTVVFRQSCYIVVEPGILHVLLVVEKRVGDHVVAPHQL